SEIIRQRLLRETQAQKNMTDVRDAVAGTYKQIGADNLAKTAMSVQPDDPLVQTAQIVTDPSTYLMGAGEALLGKVFGGAVKAGTRLQRFTEAGVRVGEIEDHLATTALARTNLEAALHGPVPLNAEVKAGLESQVARIKTVQANLSDTYSAAKAEQQTALAAANDELTKMAAASPVAGSLGKLMQAGGATATKVIDAFSNFPEAMADRFVAGGSEAEKAAFALSVRKAGLGTAAALTGNPVHA